MKKIISSVLTLFFALSALAQKENKVTIGNIDSIQSKILNEQRKIWIHVPGSWTPDSKQRYPVLYLLDGDAHFSSVVGVIHQLSEVNSNTVFPEMIVVGIPNTDRARDLTPTHVKAAPPYTDSLRLKTTGGGERFVSFLEKELMPRIDSLYPTQPFKILTGHSFGGLTVMNVVLNHTKLFNAYICIDPSMWWDDMNLLHTAQKSLSEKKFAGTTLYVGIANTLAEGMDINSVRIDTTKDTRHIRSILKLDQYIKAQKQNGLRYESKYYSNDDHSSVPLITTYDALRFLFNNYSFKPSAKDVTEPQVDLAGKFVKHYQELSKMLGYKLSPPENVVNNIGCDVLEQKQYAKARGLFQINMENYPQSYNVFDSYGDYFLAIGDKPKAIEYFKKALVRRENPVSRKKLDELLSRK